ncbi:MAG TPA: hypothetical protein VG842_09475 [Sediminibacterium sp.]|nr:hypothetical protein [Sediminibacterium sp.]
MKKTLYLLLMICLPWMASSQESTDWQELNAFHSLMSKTFHPSEEGNLAPLRMKSDSLVQAAQKWNKAPVPAGFKPAETKEQLARLEAQCQKIHTAVRSNAPDANLAVMIREAHEIFHKIVEDCRKAE